MAHLQDFWFPLLLFLAACVFGIVVLTFWHASVLWRRILLTATVVLTALAILSFIWGDPVRGPFAHLLHPRAKEKIDFWAGAGTEISTQQLSDGFDFSHFVRFGDEVQPIQLWIQRTWPFRWRFKLKLFQGNTILVNVDEDSGVQYVDSHFDMNYDDRALEVMSDGKPIFQLIASDDYDFYINAVMASADNPDMLTIMNGKMMRLNYPRRELTNADFPQRIFKYPSFARLGERD